MEDRRNCWSGRPKYLSENRVGAGEKRTGMAMGKPHPGGERGNTRLQKGFLARFGHVKGEKQDRFNQNTLLVKRDVGREKVPTIYACDLVGRFICDWPW